MWALGHILLGPLRHIAMLVSANCPTEWGSGALAGWLPLGYPAIPDSSKGLGGSCFHLVFEVTDYNPMSVASHGGLQ